MAKRFTDTEKWRKPFIKELSTLHKVIWFYILDECDHAGIWEVEHDVMEARLKEKIDLDKFLLEVGDHIKVIEGGRKWFIQDFVDFQYGELTENNRMHVGVIHRLSKYSLLKKKPLISPFRGAKGKGKDKGKDKEGGVGETKYSKLCPDCGRTFNNELMFESHLKVCRETAA